MKLETWPEVLAERVNAARHVPFAWGSHDCVHFAVDTAAAITGRAFGPLLPDYDDARSALRALRASGHEDLQGAVTAHLGEPIPPNFAQRGDLVLVPSGIDAWPAALAVCVGTHAVSPGEDGLIFMPMHRALAAWRVD